MSFLDIFPPPPSGDSWFPAGLSTSYANITSSGSIHAPALESITRAPGCKVFHVSSNDSTKAVEITPGTDSSAEGVSVPRDLKDQVVVFQYQGQFHAINHSCPHSSYPLSRGTPFDIEDFGIRLSAGIRCPKHDWSFDLVRGTGDRGNYRLTIWETQLRPVAGNAVGGGVGGGGGEAKEVWVRRRQRMG